MTRVTLRRRREVVDATSATARTIWLWNVQNARRRKREKKNCFDYQDDDKSVLKKLYTIVKSMAEKKKKIHYIEFLEWKKTQTNESAARKIAAVVKPKSDSENEGSDLNLSDLDDLDELCNSR